MTRIYDALQRREQDTVAKAGADRPMPRVLSTRLPRNALVSLYNSIEARLEPDAPRIIEIVSATHGEGTTTVARDLAVTVAEGIGKRVVLLTVVRSRSPRPAAGVSAGLEAVLRGEATVDQIVDFVAGTSLYEINLSADDDSRRYLFNLVALDAALRSLLAMADLVIIDAPPVLADVAAVALARPAGGVILVVEAERTRAPIVEEARRTLESHGGKLLGVVMNKRQFYIPAAIYRRL